MLVDADYRRRGGPEIELCLHRDLGLDWIGLDGDGCQFRQAISVRFPHVYTPPFQFLVRNSEWLSALHRERGHSRPAPGHRCHAICHPAQRPRHQSVAFNLCVAQTYRPARGSTPPPSHLYILRLDFLCPFSSALSLVSILFRPPLLDPPTYSAPSPSCTHSTAAN